MILAASALLTACATATPASAPAPTQTDASQTSQPSRAAQMLAQAGRADAPSQAQIERTFGAPDILRREGAGAAWTYRTENCALLLLFSADARNELRLADVHPSARRAGGQTPSLEQCATEVSARRS